MGSPDQCTGGSDPQGPHPQGATIPTALPSRRQAGRQTRASGAELGGLYDPSNKAKPCLGAMQTTSSARHRPARRG